ncbi:MAG: hypothetical protein IKI68_00455 [Clostridia bacterium]|nr:hypothetical protein [Clostridia bacterium]
MKKLICLTVCMLLIFSFAGCKEEKPEESHPTLQTEASGVDIEKYVKSGKIPEVEFSLGDDVDTVKSAIAEKDTEGLFQVIEGDDYTIITTPDEVNLVYETEKKEEGIKYIVSLGTSYGFANDVDPNTVSLVMKEKGYKASLKTIPEKLTGFFPGSEGLDCLNYEISGYSLNFVFENNYLTATILCKKG